MYSVREEGYDLGVVWEELLDACWVSLCGIVSELMVLLGSY
jgi:hypothetical protein